MSPTTFSRAFCATFLLATGAVAQADRWFTVSTLDNMLRRIDPLTAATLSSVPITTSSRVVNGGNGLATHPHTNELWAVLQLQGTSGSRALAKIDPQTGVATVIGLTGLQLANIAFDVTGRLFGVTGDGGNPPETLFTLDLTNGTPTLFLALGNGSFGEAIGYHLPTNSLFHASGSGTQNQDELFERIDLATRTVTNVPLSGGDWEEVLSVAHFAGDNLLVVDWNFDLWAATTTGRIRVLGTLDHDAKGLANVRTAGGAGFTVYGAGCRAPGGEIPILGGSGTPSSLANVTLRVRNGPASAPGILALGVGTGSVPLVPGCDLQNLPLTPIAAPFTLDAMGAFDFPLTVPFVFSPFDGWFQAVMLSGGQLTLANPVRMHAQ